MRNYIFLNRSKLSIATDLSAWHVEATPPPDNMLKYRDRLSGKILSYRNTSLFNQGNWPPGASYGHKPRPLSCILHSGTLKVVLL